MVAGKKRGARIVLRHVGSIRGSCGCLQAFGGVALRNSPTAWWGGLLNFYIMRASLATDRNGNLIQQCRSWKDDALEVGSEGLGLRT